MFSRNDGPANDSIKRVGRPSDVYIHAWVKQALVIDITSDCATSLPPPMTPNSCISVWRVPGPTDRESWTRAYNIIHQPVGFIISPRSGHVYNNIRRYRWATRPPGGGGGSPRRICALCGKGSESGRGRRYTLPFSRPAHTRSRERKEKSEKNDGGRGNTKRER